MTNWTVKEFEKFTADRDDIEVTDQMNTETLSAAVSGGSDGGRWVDGDESGHVSQAAPVPTEHDEQAALFAWAAAKRAEWPELRMLYANVNGQYRPGQRPEPGLMAGVPDVFLGYMADDKDTVAHWTTTGQRIYELYGGMYIELKRRNRRNEKNGGLSEDQLWWIAELRREGYFVAVCYGADEAIDAIIRYLGRTDWK